MLKYGKKTEHFHIGVSLIVMTFSLVLYARSESRDSTGRRERQRKDITLNKHFATKTSVLYVNEP